MGKKILVALASIAAVFLFFTNTPSVFAESDESEPVIISVFVREDCGHCKDEKEFLAKLVEENKNVATKFYDLSEPTNQKLFNEVAEKYKLVKGTPITLVRNIIVPGFATADTTGAEIKKIINEAGEGNTTFEAVVQGGAIVQTGLGANAVCDDLTKCENKVQSYIVDVPFFGETDVGAFSLSAISLTLGFVDGFNPCAMWVLVMFLIILAGVGSRKRMFQYAGLFIFAESIMYYAILTVWLTAWDFISLDRIVTPLVGFLAVASGVYFIYKFVNYKPVCDVAGVEQSQKLSARAKELAAKPMTWAVAAGILGLAFSVNIFEFACSIGIPQTFTKIIELNQIGWLGRQLYMAQYILMYMVDDLVVFSLALYSIDKMHITEKYSKWSSLIGGVLMIILGIILLTKPELLVF